MISQTLCTSFKRQLLLGVHDFRASGGDTFKLALYTAGADLNAGIEAYTPDGEVTGAGYVAGGITLTNEGVGSGGSIGFTSFDNVSFSGVVVTARGALIYNTTPSALAEDGSVLTNPAVCVLDFGEDKVLTGGSATVLAFPVFAAATAIIRIA